MDTRQELDGFCPLGPVLVTSDEIADPQDLDVRCVLNNETMQNGNPSDMIFTVAQLITHISRDTTLLPGTLVVLTLLVVAGRIMPFFTKEIIRSATCPA